MIWYNGSIPNGDRGRRKSKFILKERSQANGLKALGQHLCKNTAEVQELTTANVHSIAYTLSRNQTVVVQYTRDEETDMFQVGRSPESQIDFIVMDTVPNAKTSDELNILQSTISRFACRIVVQRKPPYTAKIYAAGFDSSKNIFLGEKAIKWRNEKNEIDGVTTNGILLMHMDCGKFNSGARPTKWKEISVGGRVFDLSEGRLKFNYQSAVKYFIFYQTRRLLEIELEQLNSTKPQCPVGLNTLVIKTVSPPSNFDGQIPFVYVSCGHVHGNHDWGVKEELKRECPLCRTIGSYIPITMGIEPSFYISCSDSTTTHCFQPCGHITSESTALHWSKIKVPLGCRGLKSICPFCSTALSEVKPFVKLIFQDSMPYNIKQ
ncbi:unnamed protein product [Didymodactylos carnosus]|uniref:Uncharacterized protein n=1 Tax=Didymodactylos carnosus TaxID=1234261 RepID=A0A8S2CPV1_9BILA|nr:unnamed protein product [Didymodactylos carnosus]CAF3508459.1 unnamed protein product [Didymodactylos carnosus]